MLPCRRYAAPSAAQVPEGCRKEILHARTLWLWGFFGVLTDMRSCYLNFDISLPLR